MIASAPPFFQKNNPMKNKDKDAGYSAKVRRELDYLLGHGVKVTVDETRYERKWPWGKPVEIKGTREIEIQQPTLAVLDLINFYLQDIDINEERLKSTQNPYPEIRRLSKLHLHSVAMAIAVASLGRESFVKTRHGYRENRKRIEKRAEWLTVSMTPGKLIEVAQAVSVMCNLSDFLNSIRLLSIAPDRIEETVECTDPGAGAEQ